MLLLGVLLTGLIVSPAQADRYFNSLPLGVNVTKVLTIADDKTSGYSRSLFKHWIDEDKNGCDTRAEILIQEAITKPKVGTKCKLTGGKWLSTYDGKTLTNSSSLDVDHLVPLAEAWRSGAWKWTAEQRQEFANDLIDLSSLNAVSAESIRSKGDKDPTAWLPKKDQCEYLRMWQVVKLKYSLTVDAAEAKTLKEAEVKCQILTVTYLNKPDENLPKLPTPPAPQISIDEPLPDGSVIYSYILISEIPNFDSNKMEMWLIDTTVNPERKWNCQLKDGSNSYVSLSWPIPWTPALLRCAVNYNSNYSVALNIYLKENYLNSNMFSNFKTSSDSTKFLTPALVPKANSLPDPNPTVVSPPVIVGVTPGAFCSPAGALGKSSSGVTYTCKTSSTDTRNRWRQ
jgi:hypothetical protein